MPVPLARGVGGAAVLVGLVGGWLMPATASAQPRGLDASGTAGTADPVIDVPFVGQTELMCGAAAVVMSFRYWGDAGISPEAFADLVREDEGGIRTGDLLRRTRDLGWEAAAFVGDVAALRTHLSRGRPLVALIEVGGGRFHFVTVVGLIGDRVVYHDPAVSPYGWLEIDAFDRAWAASGRWTMLVLPESGRTGGPQATARIGVTPEEPPTIQRSDPMTSAADRSGGAPDLRADASPGVDPACDVSLRRAAESARAENWRAAEMHVLEATDRCPDHPRAMRERAGLRLRQGRVDEAVRDGRRAAALDPDDALTREILAAALFVSGDESAALDEWHRLGQSTLSAVELGSTTRTRQGSIVEMSGLEPGEPLIGESLASARRRVASIPAASDSRIDVRPEADGRVAVEIGVAERPAHPFSTIEMLRAGAGAVVDGELRLEAASFLGKGELATLRWGWQSARRSIGVGLDIPGRLFGEGVWSLRGDLARETYGPFGGTAMSSLEDRRRAALGFSSWSLPTVRWSATVALDRWDAGPLYGSFGLAGRFESLSESLTAYIALQGWASARPGPAFARGDAGAAWRSRPDRRGAVLHVRGGLTGVTEASPRSIWPGAGTGIGRPVLARAHPLLEGGVVTGPLFGRGLVHGGAETIVWGVRAGPLDLAPAVFFDAAHSTGRVAGPTPAGAFETDAGVGLRVGLPGGGTLRTDVAIGLRDGATAWSISFRQADDFLDRD